MMSSVDLSIPVAELHTPYPKLLDLACKLGAKSVPPVPNGFIANIHTAFIEKVFDIPKSKRKSHIKHYCKLDDLRARFEIAERYWIGHGLDANIQHSVGQASFF